MISWQKIKLGDVCTLIKGVTYKSVDYASVSDGLVFLTLKSIAKGGGFNFDGTKYYKGKANDDQFVSPNDLIIANTDLTRAGDVIGAPLFVPQIDKESKYVYSMDITKIVTDESKLNRNYLYHYLLTNNVRNYMKGISNGSTVLHLRVDLVNKLDIPLPPLDVQKKIAQKFSDIDAEIQYTDQIIQKTEILKRGIMKELLTKGIGHRKFKKTKIGEVPEEWIIHTIKQVSEKVNVGFVGTCERYYTDNSGIPMIRTGDIKQGRLNLLELKYVTKEFNEKNKKSQVIPDDILIARHGDVGQSTMIPSALNLANCLNVVIVRANKQLILPKFLTYFINSPIVKTQINMKSGGSTQSVVNTKEIANCALPLPGLSEQKEILKILESIDGKLDVGRRIKNYYQTLKNGLTQDIFSQKILIN